MTFSVVAFDANTGELGVAVQSKFICVGAIVPWAKVEIGAIATQAMANVSYGPNGLKLLAQGLGAKDVLQKLISEDEEKEHRQLAVIDTKGGVAAHTGKECFEWAGHIVGDSYSVQGNILISEDTVETMSKAYETAKGDISNKLLASLSAGGQEGMGDRRGKQSASLLVVREGGSYGGYTDRLVDIRVDEHTEPIKELRRIFDLYDMIFLTREAPENLLQIDGDVETNIRSILMDLGYLEDSSSSGWGKNEQNALEAWFGINNFENKWNSETKIWKSVYDFMITEKGTPAISLRKMSEL